ncbi:hypothetical protein KC318_g17362 [Hortaea werneckii]|nr:hypothetical protein KC318_g17362 [Hortaea werneckii]
MADAQPPLTWEGSASSNPIVSDTLPDEVITCLQNSRFLHLATALNNRPHVSLMNYTYLPTHPFVHHTTHLPLAGPLIIMTSNPSSKKTLNLLQNPNVSLLVHDWVSSRPPHLTGTGERERSPTGGAGGGRASSLANMLMQMNSAAVSSISATMNGEAMVLEAGTEEERWCREQHLLNNTFEAGGGGGGGELGGGAAAAGNGPAGNGSEGRQGGDGPVLSPSSPSQPRSGDGGRSSYIEDQDVRVVVVRIRDGRISDWKGGVKDFVLSHAGDADGDGGREMVNGVGH